MENNNYPDNLVVELQSQLTALKEKCEGLEKTVAGYEEMLAIKLGEVTKERDQWKAASFHDYDKRKDLENQVNELTIFKMKALLVVRFYAEKWNWYRHDDKPCWDAVANEDLEDFENKLGCGGKKARVLLKDLNHGK